MSRMLLYSLCIACCFIVLAQAAGEEDAFGIQPEIHHVFRQEEKMPPAAFSKLFTLITLAPWAVFLGGMLQLGYTPAKIISELTSGSSVRTVSILAFVGSLVSFEYLFYLYWTKLNLLEILPYFLGLSVVTFFTGQRALNSIQQKRLSTK